MWRHELIGYCRPQEPLWQHCLCLSNETVIHTTLSTLMDQDERPFKSDEEVEKWFESHTDCVAALNSPVAATKIILCGKAI